MGPQCRWVEGGRAGTEQDLPGCQYTLRAWAPRSWKHSRRWCPHLDSPLHPAADGRNHGSPASPGPARTLLPSPRAGGPLPQRALHDLTYRKSAPQEHRHLCRSGPREAPSHLLPRVSNRADCQELHRHRRRVPPQSTGRI